MKIGTIGFSAACDFVDKIHRHNDSTVGHIYSLGLWKFDNSWELIGVAICGRPTGRFLDDGETIEVYRNCVKEGNKNACSMLYGAAIRTAKAKGFRSVITFTLMSEPGTSTKAANFYLEAENVGSDKGWTGKRKYKCKSQELKRRWRYWTKNNYTILPEFYFKPHSEYQDYLNEMLWKYLKFQIMNTGKM